MDGKTAGIAGAIAGAIVTGIGAYFYMKDRCDKETDAAVCNTARWYGQQLDAEAGVRRAREDHIRDLREENRSLRDRISDMSSKQEPPSDGPGPARSSKGSKQPQAA